MTSGVAMILLMDVTTKAQATEEKTDKPTAQKFKTFCALKDTTNRVKTEQPTEC